MEQGRNTNLGKGNPEIPCVVDATILTGKAFVCDAGYAERKTGRRSEQTFGRLMTLVEI